MAFALNFYHDQISADGSTTSALPAAHRLLYVRHGQVVVNNQSMDAGAAAYCAGPVTLKSSGDWSQVWRWDLAPPNDDPLLHQGTGVLSSLRMARVISNLAMPAGTRGLPPLAPSTQPAGPDA